MFSFLMALTLSMALAPVQPALSVDDYLRDSWYPYTSAVTRQTSAPPAAGAPVTRDARRVGVEISARSAVVVDLGSGKELFAKGAGTPQPIASITKLLTALTVLESEPDWEGLVTIGGDDVRSGNIPYVIPGEVFRLRDLFDLSLVASANTATVALAGSTGLSPAEFADRMNDLADRIGMTDSYFDEPTGLSPENVASARDVAKLLRRALESPEITRALLRPELSLRAVTGLRHRVWSTDDLLHSFLNAPPYEFLGGKTGYLNEAGYCFGAGARDAQGHGVIAVVLDSESREARFKEVKELIFWAFDAFSWD